MSKYILNFIIFFVILALGVLVYQVWLAPTEDLELAPEAEEISEKDIVKEEALIVVAMSQIRTEAILIYDDNHEYTNLNCNHTSILPLCERIQEFTGKMPVIKIFPQEYCAYAQLSDGDYYLINSLGFAEKIESVPASCEKLVSQRIPAENESDNQNNNMIIITQGLEAEILQQGEGEEAKDGDSVSVHYTGTLVDGTKFDSSVDRGQPFQFGLGAGQVIQGWDLGVKGMKVGEKRKLTIAPELGYGDRDMGSIPPNSTLIFEVELLGIN